MINSSSYSNDYLFQCGLETGSQLIQTVLWVFYIISPSSTIYEDVYQVPLYEVLVRNAFQLILHKIIH